MTEYRITKYPDAAIGNHYSIDFKTGDKWFVRQLFKTRKEAEKILKELKDLQKPIDNS